MSFRYFENEAKRWIEPARFELVRGAKPWLAEVREPLTSKVPSPALALAYCCYISTVIFYVRPYQTREWHHLYRWKDGWCADKPGGHLEQWASVDAKLTWHTALEIDGEAFELVGSTATWRGRGRGWWMRHRLRRAQKERAA